MASQKETAARVEEKAKQEGSKNKNRQAQEHAGTQRC